MSILELKTSPQLFAAALFFFSISVQSHHSTSRYDTQQSITVEGLVTRLEWRNPHVYIYIDQVTDAGEKVNWEIEGTPPAVMRRLGWSKETLAPGEAISVTGNPHRERDIKSIFPATISRGNKDLFSATEFFSSANNYEEPTVGTDSLAGHWFTIFNMPQVVKFVVPNDQILTEVGKKSVAEFDEPTMLPALNCVKSPAPMSMLFPDLKKVEIGENHITIRGEYENTERIIRLTPAADHPEPTIQGYSVGSWQGSTLVIETNNFQQHRAGNGAGLASGSEKSLREWITLNDDGKSVHYRYELNDPQYYAEPITGEAKWVYQPDAIFDPETCDLENARKFAE